MEDFFPGFMMQCSANGEHLHASIMRGKLEISLAVQSQHGGNNDTVLNNKSRISAVPATRLCRTHKHTHTCSDILFPGLLRPNKPQAAVTRARTAKERIRTKGTEEERVARRFLMCEHV